MHSIYGYFGKEKLLNDPLPVVEVNIAIKTNHKALSAERLKGGCRTNKYVKAAFIFSSKKSRSWCAKTTEVSRSYALPAKFHTNFGQSYTENLTAEYQVKYINYLRRSRFQRNAGSVYIDAYQIFID